MTVSKKPAKHPVVSTAKSQSAQKLPGVLFLIKDATVVTFKLKTVILGYVAWLLIPIGLLLIAQNIPAPYTEYLITFANTLTLILSLWVTAAITLYVAVIVSHDADADINFTALGNRAWEKVLNLFVIQVLTVIAVVCGLILFVIPGIVLWVWTIFAVQESILSAASIKENFKTSYALVKGQFWAILFRLVMANLIFTCVIGLALGTLMNLGHYDPGLLSLDEFAAWPIWLSIGFGLIILPVLPVALIFQLLLYFAVKKSYPEVEVNRSHP
ncbi:MAG: hypothetical protein WAZ14_00265 [Patescibacteria group bacterium]